MEGYLASKGNAPGVGPEVGNPPKNGNGIAKYKSPHGSTRYVYYIQGRPVSALQVVSHDKKNASVANVYTDPLFRRRGLAEKLFRRAQRDFDFVGHASESNLSEDAKKWIDGLRREKSRQLKRALRIE